LSTITDKENF